MELSYKELIDAAKNAELSEAKPTLNLSTIDKKTEDEKPKRKDEDDTTKIIQEQINTMNNTMKTFMKKFNNNRGNGNSNNKNNTGNGGNYNNGYYNNNNNNGRCNGRGCGGRGRGHGNNQQQQKRNFCYRCRKWAYHISRSSPVPQNQLSLLEEDDSRYDNNAPHPYKNPVNPLNF